MFDFLEKLISIFFARTTNGPSPLMNDHIVRIILSYLDPHELHSISTLSPRLNMLSNEVADNKRPFIPISRLISDGVRVSTVLYQDHQLIHINPFAAFLSQGITNDAFKETPVHVFNGNGSTFVITDHGSAYAIGNNGNGQLGFPVIKQLDTFRKIEALDKEIVIKICTHSTIKTAATAFITQSGKLFCSGNNIKHRFGLSDPYLIDTPTYSPIPAGENVIDVQFGEDYMLVLTKEGHVYGSGMNSNGQLGINKLSDNNAIWETDTFKRANFPNETKIKSMQVFGQSSFFIAETGDVYACGDNGYGQLGLNLDNGGVFIPHQIYIPDNEKIQYLKMFEFSTFFVSSSGKLLTCGRLTGCNLAYPNAYEIRKPSPLTINGSDAITRFSFHPNLLAVNTSDGKTYVFSNHGTWHFDHKTQDKVLDYHIDHHIILTRTDQDKVFLYARRATSSAPDIETILPMNARTIRVDHDDNEDSAWLLSTSCGKTFRYNTWNGRVSELQNPPLYARSETVHEIIRKTPALQNQSATRALCILARARATDSSIEETLTRYNACRN